MVTRNQDDEEFDVDGADDDEEDDEGEKESNRDITCSNLERRRLRTS